MSSIRSRYDFTESTRRSLLDQTRALFDAHGVPEPSRSAEWLMEEALGCSRAQLIAHGDRPVAASGIDRLMEMVERRMEGEPLQYILGRAEFYGLDLAVGPAVLIPRPETERAVDRCLELIDASPEGGRRPPAVLDVGTGSGCIALAIAAERPQVEVHAADVSEEALTVARRNAARLGLAVSFFRADLESERFVEKVRAEAQGGSGGSRAWEGYELLVSNPPYVPEAERPELEEQVRAYEPALALFTGEDPLACYRLLVRHGRGLLSPDGYLVLETHAGYGTEVRALLEEADYREVELRRDWSDRPRVVSGRRPEEPAEEGA